jgi:hypothetical protein
MSNGFLRIAMSTKRFLGVGALLVLITSSAPPPTEAQTSAVALSDQHRAMFAEFVAKMAATKDGEGTLLDHSIFMYGSNMSNSDLHNNYPEPNIIVGGGNGKVKLGGQHIALPERTPIANLHLTLLQKVGIERDKFGDRTDTIAGV